MAKKTKTKIVKQAEVWEGGAALENKTSVPAVTSVKPAAEAIRESPSPPAMKDEKGSGWKTIALIITAILVVIFAYYFLVLGGTTYYFLTLGDNTFVPATEIDVEAFKDVFLSAQKVFIVMDVRGISDDAIRNNVIQCGVDFSGSSGLGGKEASFFSLDDADGCIAVDGKRSVKDCMQQLPGGMTIYVKEGLDPGGAEYFTNGMVVTVGRMYTLGTCSIKSG